MRAWLNQSAKLAFELLLAATLCAYAGYWLVGDSSLGAVLNLASRMLPKDHQLEVSGVSGSVLRGGSIARLEWTQGARNVQAKDIAIQWNLDGLLQRRLELLQLKIAHLRIEDHTPASEPTPLTSLELPILLDIHFDLDAMEWVGPPTLNLKQVSGHYVFDSTQHLLHKLKAQIAAGTYQIDGSLQAQVPMALHLQASGEVQTKHPSSGKPVAVGARATLDGTLSGAEALLALHATLQPHNGPALRSAMRVQLDAQLHPWRTQPIRTANGQWEALDLAALWPSAPNTLLDGRIGVQPDGKSWKANASATNKRAGTWDQHMLPVEKLQAEAVYTEGRWNLKALQARVGGGNLLAQGTWSPGVPWRGEATAQAITPQMLDRRLAGTQMDGSLTAQRTAQGTTFDTTLRTTASAYSQQNPTPIGQLQIKQFNARGIWNKAHLRMDTLLLETHNALATGTLSLDTDAMDAEVHLQAQLPGATAAIDGSIAATKGSGKLNVTLADASKTQVWLQSLPGLGDSFGSTPLRGTGSMTGGWEGGWQRQARDLQLQLALRIPQLDSPAPKANTSAWTLRDGSIGITGTPVDLKVNATGLLDWGKNHFSFSSKAQAQQDPQGVWQIQLQALQGSVTYREWEGAWGMQLDKSVAMEWTNNATLRRLDVSSGSFSLQGPFTSVVKIQWQPAHWAQQRMETSAPYGNNAWQTQWNTQGKIEGLGLDWLERLGQLNMANLGLYGDMVLGGQWSSQSGDGLQMLATLERTSGDLQLPSEDAGTALVTAGVRAARVELSAKNDRLNALVLWDSQRAGHLEMQASTQLKHNNGQWIWHDSAPVSGTLRAQLPRVGVWSLVAPPGWRLRGTLDADARITGTRAAPQWKGTLHGDDFSVRSTLDGIDFNQGRLRVDLAGRVLDITDFTLHGADAAGSSGGMLTMQGKVQLPDWRSDAAAAQQVRIHLQAKAQSLRVSNRADQRLVVSGDVDAQLGDATMKVRGTIRADQGMFILADDTVPKLSADIRIKSTLPGPELEPEKMATPKAPFPFTPEIAVTLDLGNNFTVQGHGLTTRLEGQVQLSTDKRYTPRLQGELHTVNGTYKAYGQELDIEDGVLRFSGPYDNPSLNVLAIRPNLQQRVGVQIGGNVLSPVVRLYADPDLPEMEKLSWLITGRAAAGGGAQTAMLQQAGMALLGGNGGGVTSNLAQTLGLDEISMNGLITSEDSAASTTPGATVTLGKRISRNFYVAYERSLAGAFSTFYVFYDLSRRFTLRGQTGEQSAIDLILTTRYD